MSAAVETNTNGGSTGEAILALTVLGVMGILIVPLPPIGLDLFLSLSIAIAVVMLLVSLSLTRPSEFSVFPSMLLIVTLFRLGLSVATTRLILLHGGEGAGAAGHLIETFGRFAVGGNLVVGAVIFLILLVVNFAVISKGSNRISEVAARFTLDALPGKQMSIDAELAAGAIDDKQARERRANLEQEAEFFGAMDGASKFVRGDAIAGLAITGINIVGGLVTGLLREHLSLSAAAETYTLLTVGDGLVQQLPALLVSTAAGIVVTRAGAGKSLSSQVATQVFAKPQVLMSAAAVLTALGLLPGMPIFAFLGLAAGAAVLSRRAARPKLPAAAQAAAKAEAAKTGDRPIDLIAIEPLELQVGAGLLPLIDIAKGGELPQRITALRKQVAGDLGLILPAVHLRDNLGLEPSQYRLLLRGLELGRGNALIDRLLALDPRGEMPSIEGQVGKDPAFGLPAKWIKKTDRPRAEAMGLTLVDPASVLTTHVSEMVRRNASELLGRQELQELLAISAKEAPKLVEDTIPGAITAAELLRVCRGLLREGLSIRDLRTILEAMADSAPRSKDPAFLLDQARRRLARQITSRVSDVGGVVHALTLERSTEDTLRASLAQSEGEAILNPDLETARKLVKVLEARSANLALNGKPTVVITPPDLRRPIFEFASRFVPDLWVVSARELIPGTSIQTAGTLQLANAL